ncbi:hypothetical protein CQA53_08600 [Helicobacter didelphidarum]|uniref:Uncharacterized protein n=1 Tax=Helicobacter didelphidarum TaxID=2040648 RepID=A0A3D8IE41_9HELI|nr:hypothetical protein [Helicobacter didelphidarum]RDU63467.1 hypothetical protein CQA53_08600 [Helicobacter didelphidarum]
MKINPPRIDKYTFNDRADKTIYLGIETNIVCADDRTENFEGFYRATIDKIINDMSATLYLGKIIFKKNKNGNLVPEYIPSKISETSFEGLNTFWLNEVNPNPMTRPVEPITELPDPQSYWIPKPIDPEGYKYLKNYYFRSPKNIVLTKEQIISYFTELHKLNSTFIKDYIDSINKDLGISSTYVNNNVYMTSVGIDIKGYSPSKEQQFIAIEYASKNPKYKSKIAYFDELFYIYLVWSLREFLIPYDSGILQEENNLLFNIGAYRKYLEKKYYDTIYAYMPNPYFKEYGDEYLMLMYYPNIAPTKYAVGYIEGYEGFIDYYGVNFINDRFRERYNNILNNIKEYKGFEQHSPNYNLTTQTYLPSPLGKYYFELKDNKNTFVEFYPRIYPSKDNPPKGWTKEMMKKLELKFE